MHVRRIKALPRRASRPRPVPGRPAPSPPVRRPSASRIRDRMTRFVGSMTMYGFCASAKHSDASWPLVNADTNSGRQTASPLPCMTRWNQTKSTRSVRSSQLFIVHELRRRRSCSTHREVEQTLNADQQMLKNIAVGLTLKHWQRKRPCSGKKW